MEIERRSFDEFFQQRFIDVFAHRNKSKWRRFTIWRIRISRTTFAGFPKCHFTPQALPACERRRLHQGRVSLCVGRRGRAGPRLEADLCRQPEAASR